jgi:hypothetical protein
MKKPVEPRPKFLIQRACIWLRGQDLTYDLQVMSPTDGLTKKLHFLNQCSSTPRAA